MMRRNKAIMIWLIVAASLVVCGALIFGGAMVASQWDFKNLSTMKYETKEHQIKEDYKNISVFTDTADIVFVPSEGSVTRVVCYEGTKEKHSVRVVDGTLIIERVNTKKWYDYIGINFGASPKITVYMPAEEYGALLVKSSTGDTEIAKDFKFASIDISESTGDVKSAASVSGEVKIKTSTGHITLENMSAGSIDLEVTTGKIVASGITCEGELEIEVSTGKANLTDVTCKTLESEGDTGDITLRNVIASERFSIERSTGDVKFEGCDAAEIFVKTDTGDVEGTLLSDKVFIVNTDTGKVSVPNSIVGGRCQIETDTGDVKITVN